MAPHDGLGTKARQGNRKPTETTGSGSGSSHAPSKPSLKAAIYWLKRTGWRVLHALIAGISASASHKFHHWMNKLADAIANASPGIKAALEGISAALKGKNPLWGAIKAAFFGLSFKTKIILVLVVALALLLGPVLLVVLLLALIVAGVVAAVRAAGRS
ncbi:hypothetical protein AB0L88_08800 [Saccharopolyspora shandongensis]|uniref:hypothetical protein n=1 Tax=Saccharopolyspora shandongensis TaxID=418495 RepID=UPI003439FACE